MRGALLGGNQGTLPPRKPRQEPASPSGSKANMMDDTIQEEINPEARVPGELGGGGGYPS